MLSIFTAKTRRLSVVRNVLRWATGLMSARAKGSMCIECLEWVTSTRNSSRIRERSYRSSWIQWGKTLEDNFGRVHTRAIFTRVPDKTRNDPGRKSKCEQKKRPQKLTRAIPFNLGKSRLKPRYYSGQSLVWTDIHVRPVLQCIAITPDVTLYKLDSRTIITSSHTSWDFFRVEFRILFCVRGTVVSKQNKSTQLPGWARVNSGPG